ncbi:hypothetical protein ABHV46_11355 [Asaia sp. BMEF1]|uniref:hypothetical protein n=1 Tax=Asaia sp. BMEF1 TaxID=3155932 RepID=UPI003F66654C
MIDKKLWDECLKDFSGASCKTLLIGTGIDELDISSCEKKEMFKEFLVYGMEKNLVIEFDYDRDLPVFSGESPEIVADRILSDWPKKTIEGSLEKDKDFFLYFITLNKFAQLWHGTRLGYVG